ncbi:Ig-like domain-containing protein [Pseudoalteromonas sp. SG44-8]|uniref:Ig-like domain-containing protein n=1 Tax=Pseudoalteromonas sp. SG44-8 TaxID=2760958 RepID=UPI0015FFDBB8|nr:Ig-like domain-containing protein [Pseudoalteromonas sp. SG44-8]MBB1396701.1 Ig-like domain-containing protein [Pseudoalteromonas sp. SG44-8]
MKKNIGYFKTKVSTLSILTLTLLSACGDSNKNVPPAATQTATATLKLDADITNDDEVSRAEINAGTPISITGTVGGDVADGDTVTLKVNDTTFSGNVTEKSFSINVPVSDLELDTDSTIEATVTTSTGYLSGEATATDIETYTVEPTITASIFLDGNVTDDDILSPDEISEGMPVIIKGTVGGDVADGDVVTLTVNSSNLQENVDNGAFTFSVPISDLQNDSDLTIEVSVTTSTGNSAGEQTATDSDSYVIGSNTTSGELIDPFKDQYNIFGNHVVILQNGNVVVTSPSDDIGALSGGSVHLFNGTTREVIASISGNVVDEMIGSNGITELPNGNFIISSPSGYGSVKIINGDTGMQVGTGITGSRATDNIGSGGIYLLESDTSNFVISSPRVSFSDIRAVGSGGAKELKNAGEFRVINGDTGAQIGSSVFGTQVNDLFSSGGVYPLSNGNFAVSSPNVDKRDTDGSLLTNVGELGVYSGTDGILVGTVSTISGGITVLSNDNIVVNSPEFDSSNGVDSGRITLISGTTGNQIGEHYTGAASSDRFGEVITPVGLNNFVASSLYVSAINGSADNVGNVSLFNGTNGSLVSSVYGITAGDGFGSEVQVQANGNYIIVSPSYSSNNLRWNGRVELRNGDTGELIGSPLEGDKDFQRFGSYGVTTLNNNNFVISTVEDQMERSIASSQVNDVHNAGLVVLVDGQSGSELNRFKGDNEGDQIGSSGIIGLSNGNYVVASQNDDVDGVADAGSAILFNGSDGSQVGTTITTGLENGLFATDINALDNGSFLVVSKFAEINGIANAGEARLYNGNTGALQKVLASGITSDSFKSYFLTAGSSGFYAFSARSADNYSGYVLIFNQTDQTGPVSAQ